MVIFSGQIRKYAFSQIVFVGLRQSGNTGSIPILSLISGFKGCRYVVNLFQSSWLRLLKNRDFESKVYLKCVFFFLCKMCSLPYLFRSGPKSSTHSSWTWHTGRLWILTIALTTPAQREPPVSMNHSASDVIVLLVVQVDSVKVRQIFLFKLLCCLSGFHKHINWPERF